MHLVCTLLIRFRTEGGGKTKQQVMMRRGFPSSAPQTSRLNGQWQRCPTCHMRFRIRTLSGPVLRNTARLSQRYARIARYSSKNKPPFMILNPVEHIADHALSCRKMPFSYWKIHVPEEKCPFPAEKCTFLQENAVFEGTSQEIAGSCYWGLACLNMANWVRYPLPLFSAFPTLESMRSGGAIPPPPTNLEDRNLLK